jgi:hypothetical protein
MLAGDGQVVLAGSYEAARIGTKQLGRCGSTYILRVITADHEPVYLRPRQDRLSSADRRRSLLRAMPTDSPTVDAPARGLNKAPRELLQLGFSPTPQIAAIELWDGWLRYQHPYVNVVKDAARSTLTGTKSAIVLQEFDPGGGTNNPYRWVLHTVGTETDDPAATLAACRANKPAGVVLDHRIADVLPPAPEAIANLRARWLVQRANRAYSASRAAERRPRSLGARFEFERRLAVVEVECAIETGLFAREGWFLRPPALIGAQALEGWLTYMMLLATRRSLATLGTGEARIEDRLWRPSDIAVCDGCTLVFVPRTKATRYCRLCRKRPAPGPLGSGPLPAEIMVPRFLEGTRIITGWRRTTAAICDRCGEPFFGRKDALACPECSGAANTSRFRERHAKEG